MSALLEVEDLRVTFGRTAAVRGASLRLEKGETHCLVGESGCGKSVTALAVMGLLARGGQRSATRMSLGGVDLMSLSERAMARIRGNRMAMIFQEPMTSLNPAYTVGSQMAEVLTRHKGASRAAALERAVELMGRVGITAPDMRLGQFPHQLSAGLRALNPFRDLGVTVVSLAKRIEEVFLPGRSNPLVLPHDSAALQLLQRVRDEAHRFAIEFHRGRRDKAMTRSVLDELPGVGPARKRLLLTHFGTPERFLQASREELEAVPGVPGKVARDIYEYINKIR